MVLTTRSCGFFTPVKFNSSHLQKNGWKTFPGSPFGAEGSHFSGANSLLNFGGVSVFLWSGAVYTMGTCHKGLLGNLGAKDGAFGKYLGKKMGRNYNQQGLETDGFGVI